MSSFLLAEVALFSPPYTTLSYSLPEYLPTSLWSVGLRVAVPLGKGVRAGIILSLSSKENIAQEFAIKPMLWPLETTPILESWYLELANQMALRHTVTSGQILANILPAGLRSTQLALRFWAGGTPEEIKLPHLRSLSEKELHEKGQLWQNNFGQFFQKGSGSKENELYSLLQNPPWPVRPSAKSQIALLEYLLDHGTVARKKIIRDIGKSCTTTLSLLVKKELVGVSPDTPLEIKSPLFFDKSEGEPSTREEVIDDTPHAKTLQKEARAELYFLQESEKQTSTIVTYNHSFELSEKQQAIVNDLRHVIQSKKVASHLLFGVTGSGKTAVYLELAKEALGLGRSVLLLAPEVALAFKLYNDVKTALPSAPLHLFHGYLTTSTKEKTFRFLAQRKEPTICVGTRSALFLPVQNVGLIILDEEHDGSFKQDEGFTYQAKEIAWYRAGQEKALLLMGSATPDIKSYYSALNDKIHLHRMDDRVGGGDLPHVEIVTLPKSQATESLLAQPAIDALNEVVTAGNQAVILLNRRGYAPLMFCLDCKTVAKCPHCDIGLAYHKGRERLICHYCGYTVPFPSPCSTCRSMNFLPMGEGTEKLEETLPSLLPPHTKILRLDRDSTRRTGQMEEILASFARKEASVLVGTQMLSKGHHFPDVTLAVVADADLGLNLPDYRAAERTFQLLVQSSGRSGRGEKKGRVIIQTRNPSHYCWDFVKNADYQGFYQKEIALREKYSYPPFIYLALIRISYLVTPQKEMQKAQEEMETFKKILQKTGKDLGITIRLPVPAPLSFLKGRKRFHCLIKCNDWKKIRFLYMSLKETMKNSSLRISLDLDPVNML